MQSMHLSCLQSGEGRHFIALSMCNNSWSPGPHGALGWSAPFLSAFPLSYYLHEPILSSLSFSGCFYESRATLSPRFQTMAAQAPVPPSLWSWGVQEARRAFTSVLLPTPVPTTDLRGDKIEDAGLKSGFHSRVTATHILIGTFLFSLWYVPFLMDTQKHFTVTFLVMLPGIII